MKKLGSVLVFDALEKTNQLEGGTVHLWELFFSLRGGVPVGVGARWLLVNMVHYLSEHGGHDARLHLPLRPPDVSP